MSEQPRLYIAGIGMITPVGANAEMTAAAVRAEVSAFQDTGFNLDDENHVRMARVPREALDESLNEDLLSEEAGNRQIRLLQLATLALKQLQPLLPKNVNPPLFLAGPEQLIEDDQPVRMEFIEWLMKQSGVNLDLASSRVVSTGRAGGLAAVDLAFRYFGSSQENFAIVAGVDTFYDGRLLQLLLEQDRLLVGGNPDGFIPGEGAAFLLVSRQRTPLHGSQTSVCLYPPGLGTEPGYRGSPEPYRGEGLGQAVAAALDHAQAGKMTVLYSSMNGESFFAKEHGVAMIRNGDRLEENIRIEHPADCFGDLGAAFGPVVAGVVALQFASGKLAPPCLICGSSDKDPRSAMVMQG